MAEKRPGTGDTPTLFDTEPAGHVSRARQPRAPRAGQAYRPSLKPGTYDSAAHAYVEAITTPIETAHAAGRNGHDAYSRAIRSQQPVKLLHDAISAEAFNAGLSCEQIRSERTVDWLNVGKDQDVVLIPDINSPSEHAVSISVRSACSSVGKNRRNHLQSLLGEVAGLHEAHPAMITAHVPIIFTRELDPDQMKGGTIAWIPSDYLLAVQLYAERPIRRDADDKDQHLEAIRALIICPHDDGTTSVLRTTSDFEHVGLAAPTAQQLAALNIDTLIVDLLSVHTERFGPDLFSTPRSDPRAA